MNYFIDSNDKALVAALDNDEYDENSLITISVALDLPYATDWKDFERVDGEIMVNGHLYKYVKRKFEKGAMILKCIPDDNKMHLQTAKADFFKLANDLVNGKESQGKKQSTAVSKLLLSDFEMTGQYLSDDDNRLTDTNPFVYSSFSLLKGNAALPEQPPESILV